MHTHAYMHVPQRGHFFKNDQYRGDEQGMTECRLMSKRKGSGSPGQRLFLIKLELIVFLVCVYAHMHACLHMCRFSCMYVLVRG